ncbi:hypothetical protein T10_6763 [Trichinella papuae]|uniref:Uncharacterized protein n=1 Tax=Trichinella papuae TaxID=268474 RepID=A0A0V1N6C8_9BILA|nr:hypothetical protein T10_6763 [Trichinella papuae]
MCLLLMIKPVKQGEAHLMILLNAELGRQREDESESEIESENESEKSKQASKQASTVELSLAVACLSVFRRQLAALTAFCKERSDDGLLVEARLSPPYFILSI